MKTLPQALYRADQVRELDRIAIQEFGIPGEELMERAGRAAFDELCRRWPRARRIGVVCGGGNNGGDGYVVARLAREAGRQVEVIAAVPVAQLKGEAAAAAAKALDAGVRVTAPDAALDGFELLVDALLGIGVTGEVRDAQRELIARMNESGRPILALDVPSGLDADTGRCLGAAVRATATISFIGLKAGCFTGVGRDHAGEVAWAGLGLPVALVARVAPVADRFGSDCFRQFAPRPRAAYKGHFGHVLVVGGNYGYAGAALMAGEAAARTGAGLVSVATRPAHVAALVAARPELMVHGIERPDNIAPLLAKATVVAIGPGLGQDEWGRALFGRVLECAKPLVVDADALGLLAHENARRDRWVLTPHAGEAARLLGCTAAEIGADRFSAAASLQASFGGVVVLKGAGTLVRDGRGRTGVCTLGNPGMATGGMGDVLTGVIAALIAQGQELPEAARCGVALHSAAADRAAEEGGERGILATDLMPHLRRLVNPA
jgi:NAD(P)H-hydrate epimerase